MNNIRKFLMAIGVLIVAVSTNAATFTVTNNNDNGAGSLRDAITHANASPAPNTVNFDPAVTGSIVLTSGQIQIAGPMAITGPGAGVVAIDGHANGRIFSVYVTSPACPAVDNGGVDYLVTISGLRLTNALRGSSATGGAIWSEHSLALDAVIIDNSIAASGSGLGFGTIYPGQVLTINNSQFLNNIGKPVSVLPGTHWGGALFVTERCAAFPTTTPVTVTVTNSVFSGNRVQPVGLNGFGGAIGLWSRADVTISDTRIVDNHVDVPNPPVSGKGYKGGGLAGTAKSITISRSEIADNSIVDATGTGSARGGGFALFNDTDILQGPSSTTRVTFVNSTLSGNVSSMSGGAGNGYGNVAFEFDNSTVSDNGAATGQAGGIEISGAGPTNPPSAGSTATPTLTLVSSIVANSSANTVDIGVATGNAFALNASNSLIENLCQTCNITVSGSGNLLTVDPMLGPLAFNGGPTRTQPLLAGSPAINAGSNPLNLTTDQRGAGFARVVDGTADMGAYEFSTAPATRLINLSTRGQVQTGNNVMIGGFIIGGSTPKKVLVRAVGPNLANYGVSGVLANPMLELHRSSDGSIIASNDDWQTATNAASIQATGLAPVSPLESAILITLPPGAYTAIVTGNGGGTGVGMVEVYEIDHPEIPLINISTRGQVQTANNVMIGGFIIQGTTNQTVLIRAVGPNLANYGVTGVLADPMLELHRSSDGAIIASNDNWQSASNAAAIQATGLAPVSPLESAILISLPPGAYTAIVSGSGGGTGVGMVEVFAQ